MRATDVRPRHAVRRTVRPQHAVSLRTHRIARVVGIGLSAVLAFGVGAVATAYHNLQGNIESGDADVLITGPRPTKKAPTPQDPDAGNELNFVLIGSDQRDGKNGKIGGSFAGMRSDTTIVAHISAKRDRVELVSIPRDSMVQIPSCTMSDGSTTTARFSLFNEAFALGADHGHDPASAAGCTIKTIEALTDVRIDGYFVVDFTGFVATIDSLGGVPMCVPNYMKAPKAKLEVWPGKQKFNGKTALAWARARTEKGTIGLGQTADIGRIGRQQQLLAAVVRTVLKKNVLTDQTKLYGFLDGATKSLKVQKSWASLTKLGGLAYALRGVGTDKITFMTIPIETYPPDHNRVQLAPAAAQIWANMAADKPLIATEKPHKPASSASPSKTPVVSTTRKAGSEQFTSADVTADCG